MFWGYWFDYHFWFSWVSPATVFFNISYLWVYWICLPKFLFFSVFCVSRGLLFWHNLVALGNSDLLEEFSQATCSNDWIFFSSDAKIGAPKTRCSEQRSHAPILIIWLVFMTQLIAGSHNWGFHGLTSCNGGSFGALSGRELDPWTKV